MALPASARPLAFLRPLASLVLLAAALAFPQRPLCAQPASEEPPAEAGAPLEAPHPSEIRQEIEKLKAAVERLTGGVSFSGFFDVRATNRRNDPSIVSIDLNPLIVSDGVPVAVDALIEANE